MDGLANRIDTWREGEEVSWRSGEWDHRHGKYPFVLLGGTHGNGRLVGIF